jgi:hypothetical protein
VEILKIFLHPPPPLGRESFVRVIPLIIQKMNLLSTLKIDCENYLLKDYHLKCGIEI